MVIEEKSIFQTYILAFFTCGIYYLYWIYETSQLCETIVSKKERNALLEVFLGVITLRMYFIYWHYRTAKEIYMYARQKGYLGIADQSWLCLFLAILPLGDYMSMGLMQANINTLSFLQKGTTENLSD